MSPPYEMTFNARVNLAGAFNSDYGSQGQGGSNPSKVTVTEPPKLEPPKVVAKGIRERTEQTFETLRNGGTVSSWELEKLGKLAHAAFRPPQMFELKKSLKFKSVKRTWDGNRTQPIKFEDW